MSPFLALAGILTVLVVFEIDYLGQLNKNFFPAHLIDETEETRDRKTVRLRDNVLWRVIARELVAGR